MSFHSALRFLLFVSFLQLGACSGVFLHPDRVDYSGPMKGNVIVEDGFIDLPAGERIHYWYLPAQIDNRRTPEKGLIVHVHGNAQNLTAHVRNVGWLTAAGFGLFVFDYRGYGQSGGRATLDHAFEDVNTALSFAVERFHREQQPVHFYGQSLGGSLLLAALARAPGRWHPRTVIIEGSFYSYQEIAQDKLSRFFLTWPLQWLPSLLLSDRLAPKHLDLSPLKGIRFLVFHSQRDPIVPLEQSEKLFARLPEPKEFHSYPEQGHIDAMWVQKGAFRNLLVDRLERP